MVSGWPSSTRSSCAHEHPAAFLSRGSSQIAQNFRLIPRLGDILTGIPPLFFIIGSEFFINYRIGSASGMEKEDGPCLKHWPSTSPPPSAGLPAAVRQHRRDPTEKAAN
jgi:hypothetical protein